MSDVSKRCELVVHVTTHDCMKLAARIGRVEGIRREGAPPAKTSESEDEANKADGKHLRARS
jgi:hypothetical protein